MPQLSKNQSFLHYDLLETEFDSGCILTDYQKYVIQNDIAEAAERRLALTYDPTKPLEFVQQEAELKGQIQILKYLLDRSAAIEQKSKQSVEVN